MAILGGSDLGRKLVTALGLDGKHVVSLELRIAVNEIITIKAEMLADKEGIKRAIPILEEYELIKKTKI